jgi:hypothetical protein
MLVFSRDHDIVPTTADPESAYVVVHTDEVCDPARANFASSRGPHGSGHSQEACTQGCSAVGDCSFCTLTHNGFCR